MRRSAILVLLIFIMLLQACSEVAAPGAGQKDPPEEIGTGVEVSSIPPNRTDNMTVMAGNQYLELLVNEATCEIAVREKSNGFVWCTTPLDLDSDPGITDEQKRQIRSLVKLTYTDEKAEESVMYSFTESVLKGQFEIAPVEGGVRIDMVLGRIQQRNLVPPAVPEERFDWIVEQMTSDRAVRRLRALYRKYELEESLSDATRKAYLDQYPILSKMNIYVVRSLNDRESREVEGYMKEAGYTFEMYDDDLVATGVKITEKVIPYFALSIEFRLDGADLVVSLPAGDINYNDEKLTLNSLEILRFFGAGHADTGGYIFLPDGSGSLLMFNSDDNKNITSLTAKVYGNDYALSYLREAPIRESMALPVFGIKAGDSALFAIIEKGDPMASLNARLNTRLNSHNIAYATFTINAKDEFNIDEYSSQGGWWVLDKNPYMGDFSIRYAFLSGGDANYSGMARYYQNYLVGKGALAKAGQSPPLYVDFLGAVDYTERFLFFPYDKIFPLTTFEEVLSLTDAIIEGISDTPAVRLKAWMNGGLWYKASTHVNVERVIGGKSGFKDLAAAMKGRGVGFYPDADLMGVRNDTSFDGFNRTKDSPRMLDKRLAGVISYDMGASMFQRYWGILYLITPNKLAGVFAGFDRDYSALGADGLSAGSLGRYLYSDFNKNNQLNLQQSVDHITGLLRTVSDKYSLAVEYGNGYALPYADHVLDIPMGHSKLGASDMAVPFMQMVLRGHLPYAGYSLNMSDDYETLLLRSVEYGAALHYTLAAQNQDKLWEHYSVGADVWMGRLIGDTVRLGGVWSATAGKTIISHEMLAQGLFETVYEGGVRVVVNYNRVDMPVDGRTVLARDFAVWQDNGGAAR